MLSEEAPRAGVGERTGLGAEARHLGPEGDPVTVRGRSRGRAGQGEHQGELGGEGETNPHRGPPLVVARNPVPRRGGAPVPIDGQEARTGWSRPRLLAVYSGSRRAPGWSSSAQRQAETYSCSGHWLRTLLGESGQRRRHARQRPRRAPAAGDPTQPDPCARAASAARARPRRAVAHRPRARGGSSSGRSGAARAGSWPRICRWRRRSSGPGSMPISWLRAWRARRDLLRRRPKSGQGWCASGAPVSHRFGRLPAVHSGRVPA